MGKVKVSGYQIAKLQKQAEDLRSEIINDKTHIDAKEKELTILLEAITSLQKLGGQ